MRIKEINGLRERMDIGILSDNVQLKYKIEQRNKTENTFLCVLKIM